MAVSGQVVLTKSIPIVDLGPDEIETVVREHARFIYTVAYAVLRNHHDAEDASQETFIRLLRHWKGWAQVRDQRAWLARTAWRVALSRRAKAPEISLDEAAQSVFKL